MPCPRAGKVVPLIFSLFLVTGALTLAQPAPPPAPGEGPSRQPPADLMGRVVEVSPDGRTITLAMPPRPGGNQAPPSPDNKPEEVKVTLTDRTRALFFGVGDGQATPTPGLMATVWLEPGSKDQAARIRFMKREADERPDVQGKVVAVAPDGRTVTIETRERDAQSGQERATGRIDVRLMPYTQTQYFAVERGGAKPTADYLAVVWFEKGSKDTAARAHFMRPER